ncbi:MAG: sugar transferase [Candidatus Gallimonas sp.]
MERNIRKKKDRLEETESAIQSDEIAIADAAVVGPSGASPGLSGVTVAYGTVCKRGFRYGVYRFFKRLFDVVSFGLMILALSWLILLCLLVKWLEDFHNPIYVSERIGKDGKPFRFYKIRTMCVNADKMKAELIEKGLNEADGPAFKMKNDPRITRVGRLYRKLSLDELLQLFNVFNGSMSVVGPRPPLPKEVEQYTEEQRHRLDVKGGLLCLWQIQHNRNALSFDEWVRLDLEYIRKQSLLLDMKIIFKGAYMVVFDHSGE